MRTKLLLLIVAVVLPSCGAKASRKPGSDEPGGAASVSGAAGLDAGPPGAAAGHTGAGGASGYLVDGGTDCVHPSVVEDCSDGFCRIEPGCFIMGSPPGDWGSAAYADNPVQVTLTRAFLIGQTEVTREQWESVGWEVPTVSSRGDDTDQCLERTCPVGRVNFFDTLAFLNRYSELESLKPCYELAGCTGDVDTGLSCTSVRVTAPTVYDCEGYRLPTEAEWEYAARAGTSTAFYSGPITEQPDLNCHPDANLDPIGWYCANSDDRAHPVAEKVPNAWGLFDMCGNVVERCNDLYSGSDGYGEGPLVDPTGPLSRGRDLAEQPGDIGRVARGGHYRRPALDNQVSWRGNSPGDTAKSNQTGFRLVRTL